jgi:protein-disulfide isomerase
MPSGKSSRQARRAPVPPPVHSKGAPRGRRPSPRVLAAAAGAIVAAAVVAVVLGITLGKGSAASSANAPAVGSLANALPGAASVDSLFRGIPQHGTTLGRSSAPVTLTEYIDLQCPYCQEFETSVVPGLVTKYVRTGKLKIVMRPWAFIGPDSVRGQAAVLAAAEQNRAFDYAALLYVNQGTENTGWLSDGMVTNTATSIPGLKVHTLLSAQSSSAVKAAQKQVDADATADAVSSTPTIFVGPSGSHGTEVTLASPTDGAAVVRAIDAALSA